MGTRECRFVRKRKGSTVSAGAATRTGVAFRQNQTDPRAKPRALPMVRPSAPAPSEALAGGAESGATGEQPTCHRGKHLSWRRRGARGRRRGQDARAAPPGCAQALIEPELQSESFNETANSCVRAAASLRGVHVPSSPQPLTELIRALTEHIWRLGGDPPFGRGGARGHTQRGSIGGGVLANVRLERAEEGGRLP